MELLNKNKNYFVFLGIFAMLAYLMAGFLVVINYSRAQEGGTKEIKNLSEQIKNKQSDIEALREKIAAYEQSLSVERAKSSSLKNQINILETQIQKKEAEINLNEDEIDETNLEINKKIEEISTAEQGIGDKQKKLARFMRELYWSDQKSALEIIIMNDSISDFFNQIQVAEKIQSAVNDNLVKLKDLKVNLESNKKELETKKTELLELQNQLQGRKAGLEDQQYSKQYLLDKTRSSEAKYQALVNELKVEQAKINNEIVALERAIRAKLSGKDQSRLKELGDVIFTWPVPSQAVTATFHDPDYPFRHIFEHPAIDIKAKQGTPLRAAASGYVAKAYNGGRYGYSYVMIIHNDGLATVYGHLSAIYVTADQFVTAGEVIGATGGMPGTNGAGRLTTGPHLHFEVRTNGIPVNPMDYLP